MKRSTDLTRRHFLRRAGLAASAVGLSGAVQAGLLDRLAGRRRGGDALAAADATPIHFVLEINLRAGFQFNSLFPSQGHTAPVSQRSSALNFYSSPASVIPFSANGSRTVYLAKYQPAGTTTPQGAATLASIASLQSGRVGLATSEAVTLVDGQHTDNFHTRQPVSSAPCPSALHAALCRQHPILSQTLLGGIEFTRGDITSAPGSLPELQAVQDAGGFVNALKINPNYFTPDELELIAGVIRNGSVLQSGVIGTFDDAYIARRNPAGAASARAASIAGRGATEYDLSGDAAAVVSQIQGNFPNFGQLQPANTMNTANPGTTALTSTLAHVAAGFAKKVMTSCSVALESDDWHTNVPALDDPAKKQGAWNLYLGNALAGFLKSIEQLPDPFDPTGTAKIADSIFITINSEFTRTPNRTNGGGNNDDGGTQAFAFLGTNVATGSYGNITPQGQLQSFDPSTGQTLASGSPVSEAAIWKTMGKLMGVPDTILNSYVPDAQAKAIAAVVK